MAVPALKNPNEVDFDVIFQPKGMLNLFQPFVFDSFCRLLGSERTMNLGSLQLSK